MKQLSLFEEVHTSLSHEIVGRSERQRIEEKFAPWMREELHLGSLVSYVGNKTVPVLRLYRYKEAFEKEG